MKTNIDISRHKIDPYAYVPYALSCAFSLDLSAFIRPLMLTLMHMSLLKTRLKVI